MDNDRLLGFEAPEWRMAGEGGFRRLPGRIVESHGGPGLFWYAAEVFADFVLRVEWRLRGPEDNSGVLIRIPPLSDDLQPAIDRGYEIQIDDRGFDPGRQVLDSALHLTGAIYGIAPARQRRSHAVGMWNAFEVTARGRSIAVRLNGEEVSSLQEATREARGHIALQAHHEGSAVQFRRLRICSSRGT